MIALGGLVAEPQRALTGFGAAAGVLGLVMLAVAMTRALDIRQAAAAAETIARLEEQLRRADEERAVLRARERAARSEVARTTQRAWAFTGMLQHELRAPLSAILGWVGILKIDQRPETLARAVEAIDRNSRRQSQMIDELLDAGRVRTARLPVSPAPERSGPPGRPHGLVPTRFPSMLAGVQVLVLDDEIDARETVRRLLENSGATVVTSGSADDALDRLSHGLLPDVIVSDIGMPDQDGHEFMQRVRRMGGPASTIPAAALTARTRVEDRRQALMAGYQSHLAKPVDPGELVALVASLTGRTGRG